MLQARTIEGTGGTRQDRTAAMAKAPAGRPAVARAA